MIKEPPLRHFTHIREIMSLIGHILYVHEIEWEKDQSKGDEYSELVVRLRIYPGKERPK